MGEVVEGLLEEVLVAVPIRSPTQSNPHRSRTQLDEAAEVVEPAHRVRVLRAGHLSGGPDDGVGGHVDGAHEGEGGARDVFGVEGLRDSVPHVLGLLRRCACPLNDGAVVLLHHTREQVDQRLGAGRQLYPRTVAELRQGRVLLQRGGSRVSVASHTASDVGVNRPDTGRCVR